MIESATPEQIRDAAAAKIFARRDLLLREQLQIKRDQETLAERERQLDRELAECKAAAKFFGISFDPPPDERQLLEMRNRAEMSRRRAESARTRGDLAEAEEWEHRSRVFERRSLRIAEEIERNKGQGELVVRPDPQASNPGTTTAASLPPSQVPVIPKRPKLRDVILDQLRAASPTGLKAAPIKRYFENTYSTKIHSKTTGMTLYRLSGEKLVHRQGQTWFYGPQAGQSPTAVLKDPGASTPGGIHEGN